MTTPHPYGNDVSVAERAERAESLPGGDSARCAQTACGNVTGFVGTLLDISAQVEAAETALKKEIIRAACAGEHDRVVALVEDWVANPPCEVLARALPSSDKAR